VIAAWDEIKREADETFSKAIPASLAHLQSIWDNLIVLITGDIDNLTETWDSSGARIIETIGDIITLGIDILAIALEGVLQLINLVIIGLVALRTGNFDDFIDAMSNAAERSREIIFGFGTDIMDLLNIPVTAAMTGGFHEGGGIASPFHDTSAAPSVTAPTSSGGAHGETSTQNFSLTVQTSAPIEPVIADFRMLAAMAKGPPR
jgi:hypothetical protein